MSRDINALIETVENIYHIRDLDVLLDRVLLEARRFVNADAGTLYLKARNRLYFSYVHNDTLFLHDNPERRYLYARQSLPVNRSSLAGYVASTGEPLLIDDVYDIQSDVSYSFNPEFDERSSYKTRSMLIVPLLTRSGATLGVLQLINAKAEDGSTIPFSGEDRLYISQFAQNAANAIETAKLNREMVLRMVELSELRDPFETSRHAKRVGAYSIEIYTKWAQRHSLSDHVRSNAKQVLMPAAMLHDVGKIAVSDAILKKPGVLSDDETQIMKLHTIYGARLFKHVDSPWDKTAAEVVLNHHERWDGNGYPGYIDDIHTEPVQFGPGKKANEIPISARIVSISDVFDALISKRAYKKPWTMAEALTYLKRQAGRQFDPELVEIMTGMPDVLTSIGRRFSY